MGSQGVNWGLIEFLWKSVFLYFKCILYTFLHLKSKKYNNIEKILKKLLKMIINDSCDLSRTDEKICVVGWGLIGL